MTDNPKRTAALAAFDRLAEGHRHSLAALEKALAGFEVKTEIFPALDVKVVFGGANAVEREYIAQMQRERDRERDVLDVLEWEREVLFGAEVQGEHPGEIGLR